MYGENCWLINASWKPLCSFVFFRHLVVYHGFKIVYCTVYGFTKQDLKPYGMTMTIHVVNLYHGLFG